MVDDYERKEMPGVGEMLLRHKVSSPRWLMGLMAGLPLVAGLVAGIGVGISASILSGLVVLGGGAALSAMFTVINMTFSTARIAISEGQIHIQLGFAGPKIPIADVASVRLAPSGSNRMGMGVRGDLRGTTTYTLWGRNDRAVHIERTDGTKVVLVVREPDAIAHAIEEAMARHARGGARVRVDAAADVAMDEGADELARAEEKRDRAAR